MIKQYKPLIRNPSRLRPAEFSDNVIIYLKNLFYGLSHRTERPNIICDLCCGKFVNQIIIIIGHIYIKSQRLYTGL